MTIEVTDDSAGDEDEGTRADAVGVFAESFTRLARLSCIAAVLVTVLSMAARYFWVADLLANLRMQQLIAIALAIVIAIVARQRRILAIVSLCMAVQLAMIASELIPRSMSDEKMAQQIRLMTMNVLTQNQNYDQVVSEILNADPDAVAVLELSLGLQQHLSKELSGKYPYEIARGENGGNFGIGLYSKFPLSDVEVFELNESIKSIGASCQGYRLIATHPLPPMGKRNFQSRNEHLRLLGERIVSLRDRLGPEPIAVMGDFNVTPWSPHFGDFEQASELRRAKIGIGITPTWYASGASFPYGLVLDHVFISHQLRCDEYRVGPDVGSDHRSVTVRIGMSAE